MDESSNHCVYILECKDGSLYTGYTNNFNRRLKMHEEGKGAKYTRGRGPFQLVYFETFLTKQEAMRVEYQIKQLDRTKKEELVNHFQKGVGNIENTK